MTKILLTTIFLFALNNQNIQATEFDCISLEEAKVSLENEIIENQDPVYQNVIDIDLMVGSLELGQNSSQYITEELSFHKNCGYRFKVSCDGLIEKVKTVCLVGRIEF
jgi:hypothetical protein